MLIQKCHSATRHDFLCTSATCVTHFAFSRTRCYGCQCLFERLSPRAWQYSLHLVSVVGYVKYVCFFGCAQIMMWITWRLTSFFFVAAVWVAQDLAWTVTDDGCGYCFLERGLNTKQRALELLMNQYEEGKRALQRVAVDDVNGEWRYVDFEPVGKQS